MGHFSEQKTHSGTKGWTYPQLLEMYFWGKGADEIRRQPREAFVMQYLKSGRISKNPAVKAALSKWWAGALNGTNELRLLDALGKEMRDEYKKIFGVVGPMMPSDSSGSPMFETGELKDATAYRHTRNKQIKEG